jgi:hypothetical protein
MKKRLTIWYRAVFLDYWYWRVRYKDGTRSLNLSYGEAKSIQRFQGGKVYIDYKVLQRRNYNY